MPHDDDDGVGYCKPPKRHQFKKGHSGNPRGRVRGSQNFSKIFAKALDRRVVLTLNGERMTITMRDAVVIQLVNSALAGSTRHIQFLLRNDFLDKNEPLIIWMSELDRNL